MLSPSEIEAASRIAAGLAGAYVVGKVWQSIIVTMILPRRVKNHLTYFAWLMTFWGDHAHRNAH